MSTTAMLKVPREWANEFKKIAEKEDPLKKWSDKARAVLKAYLDMRAANVDPIKRLNAGLAEKAAQAEAN